MSGRARFDCAGFFAPFCSPCALRCSAHALGFVFFGLCLCPGVLWLGVGGDHALFCMLFFASVLLMCSVFFSFQDLTTAEDEERTRGSGGAQWRGWLKGLLASLTR